MIRIASGALMLMASSAAIAQNDKVTFYKDIAPIFQENCQECHRPAGTNYGGMIAPMSLVSFEEARPWAKAIAKQVKSRQMPPWDAALEHMGTFSNERVLTEDQIDAIARWVESGTPRGNPKDAPKPKEFKNTGGWMIGEPDLIVPMPEPYAVGDDVDDLYAAFYVDLTDAELPEDTWITGFQCKPGSKIIHHFNCHLLEPVDGKLPPTQGFPDTDKGEIAPQGAGQYLGGVSSGTDANVYPPGFARAFKRGSRVTFDIHYHKEAGPGTGVMDRSEIGFKLSDTPPERILGAAGTQFNFAINIPPKTKDFQLGPISYTYSQMTDIIGLMPHMHMRGARAKYEAFYPDGTSEVLLDVPQYDFAWQTVYYFKDFKRVPAKTRLEYTAWYDNSEEMADVRGFDPQQTVTFGQKSTDEMMMGFVTSSPVPKDSSGP